jgi:acyl-ACP thioesterase
VPVEFVDVPARGRVFRSHRRVHLGDVDASARLRLAAVARYLQDVATDDADDAGLSDRNGVWVVRSTDLEIAQLPRYHEPVELTTFCSGFGPRWAERRTIVSGARGALVETVALWVYVDRERGRPLVLDDHFHTIYGDAAGGRRVRGRLVHDPPSPDADVRPWQLRASDFDVLDHVNNARSLEAFEDELARCLPGQVPTRARIEYRGTVERGDSVELAGVVQCDGKESELAMWLSVDDEVRVSATVVVDPTG